MPFTIVHVPCGYALIKFRVPCGLVHLSRTEMVMPFIIVQMTCGLVHLSRTEMVMPFIIVRVPCDLVLAPKPSFAKYGKIEPSASLMGKEK
ncbi:hypothetical protein PoB_004214100 [Plakobranchus ocellatus]|uniref:Uncharacterized protein n=1 Tax=Plakobranchus ocellatus TaxID=259542 RepID=A0AAV4B5D7_9GAST|nr:hypothetical protein PoB_004214100 [Plakobranchus ocellatus]